jgi:hypothetical protein
MASPGPIAEERTLLSDGAAREGGEDVDTAVVIPGLPFTDTGNTCDNIDDYDAACPWAGTGAPDVVYLYQADSSGDLTIDLCASDYDTKLYVTDVTGELLACSDDACGVNGFRSRIECLPVDAEEGYYIYVDGYGAYCGDYALHVYLCGSPVEESAWGAIKAIYR